MSAFRRCPPSHVIRRQAFERTAPTGASFADWVEIEWARFARANGYRNGRRTAAAQMHFDSYLARL